MSVQQIDSTDNDEDFTPITPEFLAHLSSGIGRRPIESPIQNNKKGGFKRTREDVTSRSRQEIINWVMGSQDLIKACICPYCLKIHSRRDNARVHIKNQHPGCEVRDFEKDVDASLEDVLRVNDGGKCEFLGNTVDAKSVQTPRYDNCGKI